MAAFEDLVEKMARRIIRARADETRPVGARGKAGAAGIGHVVLVFRPNQHRGSPGET
jgi:hypothetical protein